MFKSGSLWNPRDPTFTSSTLSIRQDSIPDGLGKGMVLIASRIYEPVIFWVRLSSQKWEMQFSTFLKLTFQHLTTLSL